MNVPMEALSLYLMMKNIIKLEMFFNILSELRRFYVGWCIV